MAMRHGHKDIKYGGARHRCMTRVWWHKTWVQGHKAWVQGCETGTRAQKVKGCNTCLVPMYQTLSNQSVTL